MFKPTSAMVTGKASVWITMVAMAVSEESEKVYYKSRLGSLSRRSSRLSYQSTCSEKHFDFVSLKFNPLSSGAALLSHPVVEVLECRLGRGDRIELTPTTLPHSAGLLGINGCIPRYIILDTEVITSMFSKAFATAIGIDVNTLISGIPFLTAGGALEEFMGVTKEVDFTLAGGTPLGMRKYSKATVVDTTAYSALGMDFVAGEGGVIDTCDECGPTIDCQ